MPNTLYYCDNLQVLREHLADESVDLVYLDPPFKSNASYNGKCSDLRGSEQPAAFQEGIETSSPPGAKEGCQGHLAVGALP